MEVGLVRQIDIDSEDKAAFTEDDEIGLQGVADKLVSECNPPSILCYTASRGHDQNTEVLHVVDQHELASHGTDHGLRCRVPQRDR